MTSWPAQSTNILVYGFFLSGRCLTLQRLILQSAARTSSTIHPDAVSVERQQQQMTSGQAESVNLGATYMHTTSFVKTPVPSGQPDEVATWGTTTFTSEDWTSNWGERKATMKAVSPLGLFLHPVFVVDILLRYEAYTSFEIPIEQSHLVTWFLLPHEWTSQFSVYV